MEGAFAEVAIELLQNDVPPHDSLHKTHSSVFENRVQSESTASVRCSTLEMTSVKVWHSCRAPSDFCRPQARFSRYIHFSHREPSKLAAKHLEYLVAFSFSLRAVELHAHHILLQCCPSTPGAAVAHATHHRRLHLLPPLLSPCTDV